MGRIEIDTLWDRKTRNDINTNFKYLFRGVDGLEKTVTNLIVEAGDSSPEVIQARGGEEVLNDRLNKVDKLMQDEADRIDGELTKAVEYINNEAEELSLKFKQLTRKITADDLPFQGIVSAHRGGGLPSRRPVAADNGVSGYDMAIRLGADIIDIDTRRTADGTFIAMHNRSVASTTDGRGYVENLLSSALPNIDASKFCGSGWLKEPIPTVEELLDKYGGRVIMTIEPKDGEEAVEPLADLIKSYKLERSVFINTDKPSIAEKIVSNGCLPHVYGCTTKQDVMNADGAGAWLIEVPHDVSEDVVNTALNSGISRVISKPIWTRSQLSEMTNGLQGHVTDALGMTNRPTGDRRLLDTIKGTLEANKRGIGWKFTGDWIVDEGKLIYKDYDHDAGASVYLGDISGGLPSKYSFNFKFIAPDGLLGGAGIRARICANIPDEDAFDTTTDGYVCNIRGNGQINLWSSNGNFGSGILLGETAVSDSGTTELVAGREYSIKVDITSTTITMTREDTGQVIGPYQNTDWRGSNIYIWVTRSAFDTGFTDVRISE